MSPLASAVAATPSESAQLPGVNQLPSPAAPVQCHDGSRNFARSCTAVLAFVSVTVASDIVLPPASAHVSPVQPANSQPSSGTAVSVTIPPRATHASAVPDAASLPNLTPPVASSAAYARNFA